MLPAISIDIYDLYVWGGVSLIMGLLIRKVKRPLTHRDIVKLRRKLERMDPYKFEEFCAKMFKAMGYKVKITPKSRDGGKDLILNNKVYVECKHYKGMVGRPVGQKLAGAIQGDGLHQGIIITTGHYSQPCLEYCEAVGILCLDLKDIIQMCQHIGKRSKWF